MIAAPALAAGPRTAVCTATPARCSAVRARSLLQHLVEHNKLTDGPTRHWTGKAAAMTELIPVEGRVTGTWEVPDDEPPRAGTIRAVDVAATHTITYQGRGDLTRLNLSSRRISAGRWTCVAAGHVSQLEGGDRTTASRQMCRLPLDASPLLAVNEEAKRDVGRLTEDGFRGCELHLGSARSAGAEPLCDDLRIDWGTAGCVAARSECGNGPLIRKRSRVPREGNGDCERLSVMPANPRDRCTCAVVISLGKVSNTRRRRHVLPELLRGDMRSSS